MINSEQHFKDRHIIVGICGGIAAYKSAELVRALAKAGARVQVVMTRAAHEFVTPMTLQALSGRTVRSELFDAEAESGMGHIELAKWADLIVIAPATADRIAALAQGRGDDLLTTLVLASEAPCVVVPAMNQAMWSNPVTQSNIKRLNQAGFYQLGPAEGSQACGDEGLGRMVEPAEIFSFCTGFFAEEGLLKGRKLVITAGPTREALDPVRYLTNHSSGKMGYALAVAANRQGADVTLISGPTTLPRPANIKLIQVESAIDMMQSVQQEISQASIFIATAAVADYRPAELSPQKIKKDNDELVVKLVKNPDILAYVAALESPPYCVGFAAETENLEAYARKKMNTKKIPMIIANQVGVDENGVRLGFESDINQVSVFWKDGQQHLPETSKTRLAEELIRIIANQLKS